MALHLLKSDPKQQRTRNRITLTQFNSAKRLPTNLPSLQTPKAHTNHQPLTKCNATNPHTSPLSPHLSPLLSSLFTTPSCSNSQKKYIILESRIESVEKPKHGKWDNDEERGHSLSVICAAEGSCQQGSTQQDRQVDGFEKGWQ
jgi:hypothetical protein